MCRPSLPGVAGLALLALTAAAAAETAPVPPAAVPAVKPARVETAKPAEAPKAAEAKPAEPARPSEVKPLEAKAPEAKPEAPRAEAPKPPAASATPAATASAPADAAAKPARKEPPPLVVARISADPVPALAPSTFVDTMRAAEALRVVAEAGGWPAVPAGANLKFGDRGAAVAALRARLAAGGDLAADLAAGDLFDAPLLAAAKRFQDRHGLPATGLVGARSIEAMNVPAGARQRQLAASAARLMGSTFAFGDRYVVVNIPSATVEAIEGGRVERRYVAVVGRKDRATPEVQTRITNVNLNPTWTVPVSLIRKDIIPHVRKDPAYLAKMGIRVLDAQGQEVDATTIDWSTDKAVNYTIRQDPGAKNSLGQVRIDMPNKHAVYLHDTPQKRLFSGDVRFHSSGCVRVSDVKGLAAWLLQGTAGPGGAGSQWGPMEVETGIAAGDRRDVKLAKPVPVAFVYLTGYATPDGRAHFRDDVYGLDSPPAPAPELTTSSLPRPPKTL